MNPELVPVLLLAVLASLLIAILLLVLQSRRLARLADQETLLAPLQAQIAALLTAQQQTDRSVRDEISRNRVEQSSLAQGLRGEVVSTLTNIGDSVSTKVDGLTRANDQKLETVRTGMEQRLGTLTQSIAAAIQSLQTTVDTRLTTLQSDNEKKLEQMRQTVDEKLQGTLEARLGESFKQVSDRLEQVYRGLGEMQTLAAGVGDLKRVLTNVKSRGTWGEVQLGALLEQILSSDQYAANVSTAKPSERVEYAIKLPGRDTHGAPVWLPIDAKFPMEDYQRLVDASEKGDAEALERASRHLETTIKLSARTLSEKYLAPPATTDFGILFLSTESLYAEAVRRPGLAEFLQREHRIVIAGPSTLAALLNSLQMGFRTLAIQQRSSEVWELLGAVKSDFTKYAEVLTKIKRKLNEAQTTVDLAETRTRAIQRRLRDLHTAELLPPPDKNQLLLDDTFLEPPTGASPAKPD